MSAVLCPFCFSTLPSTAHGGVSRCPRCSKRLETRVFPALSGTKKAPPLPEGPPGEGEAVCFYSPGRRATRDCGHCGVLISDAWAAQWGGGSVCLKCLDHLRSQAKDSRFETKRVLWDNVCLAMALLPFTGIFYFLAVVTAPASFIMGLWHWKKPRSMVPRGPWRMLLALLLAFAQMAAMALGVAAIIQTITQQAN